jgi:hypothetical protein
MKRSLTGTLLVILTAIPLLVACGVADPIPATVSPAAPNATAVSATVPATTTPVAATATRASTGTPIAMPTPDRPGTPRTSATSTRAAQGPRYALVLGEAVAIPNSELTLRFKAVTNDSRCPDSQFVTCVWAGEATVSIEVTVGTDSHTILLVIPGLTKDTTERGDNSKTHTIYKGYVIQLVSLEPQPTYTPPLVGPGTATIPTPAPSVTEKTATILVTVAP